VFLKKFGYDKSNTRYIDSNVKVEKDCFIGRGCSIYGNVKLMNYSHIENNTIIFGPAIIGKKTYIGPNCLLGYPDRERIKKTIMNLKKFGYSNISDKLEIGNECIIRSGTIIYDNVKIGNGVEFGHNVMIREKVEVGDRTIVGTNTVIDGSCKLGSSVSIQTNVYICSNSIVEDAVFLGPNCVFTNDKYAMQKSTKLIGPIIRRGASVGANSTLMPGIIVGKGSIVGAGALVSRNIPPRKIYIGNPARIKGTVPLEWKSILEERLKGLKKT
jgi:acetyltransferase-like isoleucine patch superfamily enzyme